MSIRNALNSKLASLILWAHHFHPNENVDNIRVELSLVVGLKETKCRLDIKVLRDWGAYKASVSNDLFTAFGSSEDACVDAIVETFRQRAGTEGNFRRIMRSIG